MAMKKRPMVMATRGVTLRDYVIFQIKLWLDGFKGLTVIILSTGALVLDFIAGQGRRPRLFYTVVRASERFDRWLNLYAAVERLEAGESDDGLFGASTAAVPALHPPRLVPSPSELLELAQQGVLAGGAGAEPPDVALPRLQALAGSEEGR
ncbi:MAG: hypothetical protein FIA95_14565, partial [Gemmatimonadetes bacterium]|nr:hypothetical protein [Gemmatimonadota bacterium]